MANEHLNTSTIFSLGQKVENNFLGEAYLQMVFTDPTPLNITLSQDI